MEITLYKPEFIRQIKREAAPKNCHPIQGMMEVEAFIDAYTEGGISQYQLIQVVGCGVYVSKVAAWLLMENYLCRN